MTQPLVSEPADRVVSRARRRHMVRTPTHSDTVAILRSELQTLFERLDACLANQSPAPLAVPPAPPAGGDQPDPFEGLTALISVGKAAAILGLSRATAYRLADTNELPVQRMGGRVYVVTARLRAAYGSAA